MFDLQIGGSLLAPAANGTAAIGPGEMSTAATKGEDFNPKSGVVVGSKHSDANGTSWNTMECYVSSLLIYSNSMPIY